MEKFFKLKAHNTDVKTEVVAGITTFMSMAYILAVNPNILGATGMPSGAVFTATAIASAVATILMGLIANLPFAVYEHMDHLLLAQYLHILHVYNPCHQQYHLFYLP